MRDTPLRVLLIQGDDRRIGRVRQLLAGSGPQIEVGHCGTLEEAIPNLAAAAPDAALLCLDFLDPAGLGSIERIVAAAPECPIVVIAASTDPDAGTAAVRHGAQDCLFDDEIDGTRLARALLYAIARSGLDPAAARRERCGRDAERARAEEELRQAEARLRQVQKMDAIGRLAGGIAHDFNNILAAIYGYADLLLSDLEVSDRRRADVQEIRRMAQRAASLTRQLLAFSRQQVLQPQVLDLNDVIEGMQRMLERIIGTDVQVSFEPAADLWMVRADRGQVEQVMMNLAGNARDAMPEGGSILIRTENRTIAEPSPDLPGLKPGEYVQLTVADTGVGMPEHVRNHVFEPFFTTKEQGRGTGLGLATVYGIVKQSGGSIYLESAEQQGATFCIYLPRHDTGS